MDPEFLVYKNSRVAWRRFGNGPIPVVCFHGYAEDSLGFSFLESHETKEFSFFAIDLPFHGRTEWNEGMFFTHIDLSVIVHSIIRPQGQKLYLLGFSLGGRIALSLLQAIPGNVEKIVLLAPDGLKVNFWYWLATRTWLGNKFFAFTMKKPGWFFGLLKVMQKLKLVNASIFKFVKYYIGDKEVRDVLYARWTSLRKLKPNLKRIKEGIPGNRTGVRLVYGEHDRIILSSVGEKFRKGIENYCSIEIIPSGHQVLHEKHRDEIVRALRH